MPARKLGKVVGPAEADIVYPLPAILVLTQEIQKCTNTTHFKGPPTEPWRTPRPWWKGAESRPWPMLTWVVAPPSSLPESRLIKMRMSSSGRSKHFQLRA